MRKWRVWRYGIGDGGAWVEVSAVEVDKERELFGKEAEGAECSLDQF